jgi:L-rhamnose mutarotase
MEEKYKKIRKREKYLQLFLISVAMHPDITNEMLTECRERAVEDYKIFAEHGEQYYLVEHLPKEVENLPWKEDILK